MCGRFLLSLIPEQYLGLLRIDHAPVFGPELFAPRFNIAPTQPILIARNAPDGNQRELAAVRWGLTPPWVDPAAKGQRPIFNARSETAWDKPLFKHAVRERRCVVPADGFYEWRKAPTPGGKKQPFLIRRADAAPMFFAGLWSGGSENESGAILTTGPNEVMAPIHDRMPVILADGASIDRWLDPRSAEHEEFRDLLSPAAAPALVAEAIEKVGDNRRTMEDSGGPPPSLFG